MSQEVQLQQEVTDVATKVELITIDSPQAMSDAVELLSQLNTTADRVKAEKDKVMRPLLDAVAAERKRWKPIEDKLTPLITTLRKKISVYQTAETKRVEDEKAKIAARVGTGKGKLKLDTAAKKQAEITKPEDKVATDTGSVAFKTDYEVVVTDIRKVPEQFLEVKLAAIKTAHKKGGVVPGVTINEVQVPVNRRK